MSAVVEERRGNRVTRALRDVYHERTNYQFIERSWRWAVLSGTLVLISLAALGIRHLNLGIDFTGGTAWDVQVEGKAPPVDDVRNTLRDFDQADAKISFRTDRASGAATLVVQTPDVDQKQRDAISKSLGDYGEVVQVNEVGPTWGQRVTAKALRALVAFFLLIAIYLSIRFEWRMALAAIIAVIHDIIITAGVYALTQFEVSPPTVTAFLTILGFSLYDTVVVFDKVKENQAYLGAETGDTYSKMVNRSLNQVLGRSINTSLVAVLPVASLMVVGVGVFGATALEAFALALLVGLMTGAYSSIFVATPILAWLKEREPHSKGLRDRAETTASRRVRRGGVATGVADSSALEAAEREAMAGVTRPDAPPDTSDDAPSSTAAPPPSAPGTPPGSGGIAPKPRQPRRRKRR